MKKQVFGISFNPNDAAGKESRTNNSLDKFFGDGQIIYPRDPISKRGMDKKPVEKFKTFGLPNTLPSVILRKKKVNP